MLPSFPALYLYPLNADSFVKHINLTSNQRVKIGRQTNARTVPAENNGYFDSKVLSRQHAEVWEENNKIFIKDVKSSNGTFINGERLSPEGLESEPYELKSDDIVEFGIDIVGEDNKTVIHHKVAARVVCVFSEQDAHVAARAEQHQHSLQPTSRPPPPNGNGSFSFAGQNQAQQQQQQQQQQRRPPMQPQGLGGMGGMGGSMRPPGKSGLTFDHILSRLQGELQKSRETGAELHNLTGAMSDIHDTLGGSLPSNLPPYPQALPPVRPAAPTQASSPEPVVPVPALSELQTQLHDTQSSLANHVDKVRALEGVFAEHEAIKREVSLLRSMMEGAKASSKDEDEDFANDDDARSIRTIVPHELERVEEEDEEHTVSDEEEYEDEERRRRRSELGRPRTPEPMGLGMTHAEDDEEPHSHNRPRSASPKPSAIDELTERLNTLSNQLESALELSSSLQAQHAAAQSTISALESKVTALETLVQTSQAPPPPPPVVEPPPPPPAPVETEAESLTQMLAEWKKSVEGQWSSVREEWASERERLASAREEWESKVKAVESNLGSTAAKFDAGLATLALLQRQQGPQLGFGLGGGEPKGFQHGSGGLVTPPSPRSLSADSDRPRNRRKRASSGSRGRSRSLDVNGGGGVVEDHDEVSRPYTPSLPDDSSDSEPVRQGSMDSELGKEDPSSPLKYLETPESSVHRAPVTSKAWVTPPDTESIADSDTPPPSYVTGNGSVDTNGHGQVTKHPAYSDAHMSNVSTAVGVLVLSVAAAAVLWRIKPE